MANRVADWTVDQLLSSFKTLNARADHARNIISANRLAYMETLRSLPSIPDIAARAALRTKLQEWIHKQVEVENRFMFFAQKWEHAKSMVKLFLQDVGITPPIYLGVGPIMAPVAIWGLVAAGLVLVAVVIVAATNQSKALSCITNVTQLAARKGWTSDEVAKAIRECRSATDATGPDPLGLSRLLQTALPLALVVGAIMLLGPAMKRRGVAA